MIANTSAAIAPVASRAPLQSMRWTGRSRRSVATTRSDSTISATASGALNAKAQRHPKAATSAPPTSGPSATATPIVPP